MKKIIIIGYSGHANVVLDTVKKLGFEVLGYLDKECKSASLHGLDYLGIESDHDINPEAFYFSCIGDNKIRRKTLEPFMSQSLSLIDPTAILSPYVEVGFGTFIAANVTVNSNTTIGNGVIANTSCVIEHDNMIGDFVHVAPGSVLCGGVSVGDNTMIGANSTILPGVSVGKNCVIGAGSVVRKNLKDNSICFGNPLKVR